MSRAQNLSEIAKCFAPEPLKEAQEFRDYYCETMEIRTARENDSPLDSFYDECVVPQLSNAHLLLGHRGCGKSTELNYLKQRLEKNGHQVRVVACHTEADLQNLAHWDLLFLMGRKLLEIAQEIECPLDESTLNGMRNFWNEVEIISEMTREKDFGGTVGTGGQTPGLLSLILSIFGKINASIKVGSSTCTSIREKIERRSSDWIIYLKQISAAITDQMMGKQPIIIFEDLDKMDIEPAWQILGKYAGVLSQMPFPVIYTCPIGLSYDTRYAMLPGYFHDEILPMIKIHDESGKDFGSGLDLVKKIVFKRAKEDLFDADALHYLIQKTGGLLRDLFKLITEAASIARRKKNEKIKMDEVQLVVAKLRSKLERLIERKDYEMLIEIYNGLHRQIEDRAHLLTLMQAMVVLEYNGKRWHDLHPLVRDFLEDQEIVEKKDTGKKNARKKNR